MSPRALLLVLLAACDTRVGADAAQRFLLDRLEIDIAEAERARDAHTNPSFPCHAILQTIPSFKSAGRETQSKLATAKTVCRDGARLFAEAQVARLEAARRSRGELVVECFDLEHALDILASLAPEAPSTATLTGKHKTLCP